MIPGTDYRVVDLDPERSLLFLTGNHFAFLVSSDLGARLATGFDDLRPDERAEWARLEGQGMLDEVNRTVLRRSSFEDGAALAINVNLTNVCNLACTYCFAEGGDYGRITSAMDETSVDHIFDFIDKNLAPGQRVRFEFFGGEPLANPKIIFDVCERSVEYASRRGTEFVYRISTNLTLMPQGILDLFARFRFIVSVSLDGGRVVQNANRPTKGGRGSFDKIIDNVRAVRAASDDITLVARMTVAQREPSLLANVLELWELNLFDYFQVYPGVYPVDAEGNSIALAPKKDALQVDPAPPRLVNFFLQDGMVEQFREFMDHYPDMFAPGNRFRGVLEYERTVQMVLDGMLALAFCSGGRTYYTFSPNGAISPCHRLVGDDSFDVGTGETGLERPHDEWRLPVDNHPVCGGCWARYVCGGGCRQENHAASGDINVLNDESCRYQLLLTEEVLRMLGRSSPEYRLRERRVLEDLFVSCGRPVLENGRSEPAGDFVHFTPLATGAGRVPASA